ncbi:MAG TPA: RagB/SusD family nutrient uptake outer membrane protein [Bacteroidales bacterium]|nr:RagB/SusD family nutrient uptake outer membrane protein [Bacteroidales bacterium]
MKKQIYFIVIIILYGSFSACTDTGILEPEKDNVYDMEVIKSNVSWAEGVLLNAYRRIPSTNHAFFELAYGSDEAVINDPNSGIKTAVNGGWTSRSNPFSRWNRSYEGILYINTFLEEMQDIEWYWKNELTDSLLAEKLNGEAYALRAWYYFHLLQSHAGPGSNGEMLGVPIVDKVLSPDDPSEYQIPRASFNDLVAFILDDCEKAIELIPERWVDVKPEDIDVDVEDKEAYANYMNQAIGERNTNRINGLVAQFIKVKTLLYAASPAYSDGTYTYQMAAEAAAELMDANNGLVDVAGGDLKFYNNPDVRNAMNTHPEVIWSTRGILDQNSWEEDNYPPSIFGGGRTNPTQELVNAFPMADGTPAPTSKVESNDPYSDRDPRLKAFILYNGSKIEQGDTTFTINTKSGSQDALGSADENATQTGYYLRKFMNVENVNLDPTVNSAGLHYYTYARYTDVLLMFAEAANQIVGPDGDIGGYTAREVINAIRTRAGIASTDYVNSLGKAQMQELIRNERRIEMCFEKQRFWDLRRWKMTEEMKKPVSGVQISEDGTTFNYVKVEDRNYSNYQIYGPIDYFETLKYDLVQNEGWD